MTNHVSDTVTHFAGANASSGLPYFNVHTAVFTQYQPSRKRTPLATAVVRAFSTVVNSVTLGRGVDREELFERYDRKLWTYDDRLAYFTLATIPSVLALVAIYVAFRCVRGVGQLLSSSK